MVSARSGYALRALTMRPMLTIFQSDTTHPPTISKCSDWEIVFETYNGAQLRVQVVTWIGAVHLAVSRVGPLGQRSEVERKEVCDSSHAAACTAVN